MRILQIKRDDKGIVIKYIIHENSIPEEHVMKCKEKPRIEFDCSWKRLEDAWSSMLNQDFLEDNEDEIEYEEMNKAVIDKIKIDWIDNETAKGYMLCGAAVINEKELDYTTPLMYPDATPGKNERMMKELIKLIREAKMYVMGKRAQQVLFEEEAEGNFTDINPETGEIIPKQIEEAQRKVTA